MSDDTPAGYGALDLLIVPSPLLDKERDAFLDVDPVSGLYVGGELRLSATVDFSRRFGPRKIVVVGGLDPERGSRITHAMRRFIIENDSTANVQRIDSLPCTRHNVIALFNRLGRQLEGKRVGLLTNEYHLPRFLAFWSSLRDEYQLNLSEPLAIAAESIVNSVDKESRGENVSARRKAEERGLADLRAGRYVDRCLSQLPRFGDQLTTRSEWYLSPRERAAQ